jgi:ketosteroid isomerase-like protein
MPEPLNFFECLEIKTACEHLIYAYMQLLDKGDMDAVADCFVEEGALARPMTPDQLIKGREAIRASLNARPKTLVTRHLATNLMIEVEGRDAARGISSLTMVACTPAGDAQPPYESRGPIYFGEFRDRFVRRHNEWKFLERRGSIQMKY